MTTDELIERLARETAPVRRADVARTVTLGALGGLALAVVASLLLLGPRPDLGAALATSDGLAKLVFVAAGLATSGVAFASVQRPCVQRSSLIALAAASPLAALLAGLVELTGTGSAAAALATVIGVQPMVCLGSVVGLAALPFATLACAARRNAPTDLPVAGAIAGALSGTLAAAAYMLHCPLDFGRVAIPLGLAVAASAALGAAVGRRALRW